MHGYRDVTFADGWGDNTLIITVISGHFGPKKKIPSAGNLFLMRWNSSHFFVQKLIFFCFRWKKFLNKAPDIAPIITSLVSGQLTFRTDTLTASKYQINKSMEWHSGSTCGGVNVSTWGKKPKRQFRFFGGPRVNKRRRNLSFLWQAERAEPAVTQSAASWRVAHW